MRDKEAYWRTLLPFAAAPVIKRRIEPLEVALGHLAKFTCEVQIAPNVRFQWFKAGREIYESDKCSIRSSKYVSTLEILRTQVVDCGEYTCKASNEYGSVSCTATLTVTGNAIRRGGWPISYYCLFCFSYRCLPGGETNSRAVTWWLGIAGSMWDKQSFFTVVFLRAAKEKIKIAHYFENNVKESDEQWHLKVWFAVCFFVVVVGFVLFSPSLFKMMSLGEISWITPHGLAWHLIW